VTETATTPTSSAPARPAAAPLIGMTDQAAQRIQQLVAEKGLPDGGLRVKVVGGGCSGLTYKMDIDQPRDGDKVFEHAGAKMLVDRKSFLYLKGTELDFSDDLMSSGFVLQNPNVKRTCGCGSSFIV
jgi:iron-sulfur cluster assembly protein